MDGWMTPNRGVTQGGREESHNRWMMSVRFGQVHLHSTHFEEILTKLGQPAHGHRQAIARFLETTGSRPSLAPDGSKNAELMLPGGLWNSR